MANIIVEKDTKCSSRIRETSFRNIILKNYSNKILTEIGVLRLLAR